MKRVFLGFRYIGLARSQSLLLAILMALPTPWTLSSAQASTTSQIPATTAEDPLYLLIAGDLGPVTSTFAPMPAGSPHQIGFAPILYTLKTAETELAHQVNAALDLAERTSYPVFFHSDDWNFPEDWKDPSMVEWTAFPKPDETYGPTVRRRWINWGSWIVTPPPPNYESPRYQDLLRSRLTQGTAQPIAERLKRWKQTGKTHLFAGIAVGWETGFYNLTEIDPNNRPTSGNEVFQDDELVRTGYAALHARGYNNDKIHQLALSQGKSDEQVMYDLMVDVLHDHTEFMAKVCQEAGIPKERIYSHYATMRSLLEVSSLPGPATPSAVGKVSPMETMLRANPNVLEKMKLNGVMVPLEASVNPYCRPGITAAFDFSHPIQAAKDLYAAGCQDWGAVEIEITDDLRDAPLLQSPPGGAHPPRG